MFVFGRRPSLCWLPLQFEGTKKGLHAPELCSISFLIEYFLFSSHSLSHCAATCGCSCFSADIKNNNRWAVINRKKSRCPSCCCRHSFQIQTGFYACRLYCCKSTCSAWGRTPACAVIFKGLNQCVSLRAAHRKPPVGRRIFLGLPGWDKKEK